MYTWGFEILGVARGFVWHYQRELVGWWQGQQREKEPLTQILLEQPGEHRVPVRDKIRLPLL